MSSTHMRTSALGLVVLILTAAVVMGNGVPQASTTTAKLIHVDGQVSVNGATAIAGASVSSGSAITTAARSSAVVSLGKLGRVEVLPSSTMNLSFGDANVAVAMLDQGRVRVSSSSGVNATTTTRDGQISTIGNQRNEFIVDTSCGNTFVAVKKGTVELRAGSTVKQIAAGNQDTAGTATPGCTPSGE
ncbi:MAG TPA: hypothetical protein VFR12_13625 [Pyrinomonadaceae bacterium]|nr:hypothetical protein [Pyrinomonadaceae bacterium]